MPSVGLALLLSNCTIEHSSHVSRRGVGHGNAVRDYRWPNQTIPYYFDASWDPASLEVVMRNTKIAADEIERMVYTYGGLNLSFVDTTNTTEPKDNHLRINMGAGCSATVGYNPSHRSNFMNIGLSWCFSSEAILKHELGHVLGLWHEQQHPFVSRYLKKTCEMDNSCDGNCRSRGPFMVTTTPYDFLSIMHYGLGGCGGMEPTPFGAALLTSQNMVSEAVGGVQNVSVHDAQMIASEYADERIADRGDYCTNVYEIPSCDDQTRCIGIGHLGNGVCNPELNCYYLDGGDCDTAFSPFGKTDHTIVVTEEKEKVVTYNDDVYWPGFLVVSILLLLFVIGCVIILSSPQARCI